MSPHSSESPHLRDWSSRWSLKRERCLLAGLPKHQEETVNHSLELWNTEPLNEGVNRKEPMCAQPNLWGTRSGLIILEHSPSLCSLILAAPKSTSHVSLSVTSLWLCMRLPSQSPCRRRHDSREKAPRKHCSRHPGTSVRETQDSPMFADFSIHGER